MKSGILCSSLGVCLSLSMTLARAGDDGLPLKSRIPHRPALFKDARQALAIARAQGRHDVVLLVIAAPGGSSAVAREAERLGGNIRFRADEVGYLRVRIPLDKATQLSEFKRVEAATVSVDEDSPARLSADEGNDQGSLRPPQSWPPETSDYPLRHPYSPLGDLDAKALRDQHPTWDGRGVTIAVLDSSFDMLLPEFHTAYSFEGEPIPKVADYLIAADPRDEADQTPQWVDMATTVVAKNGEVGFNGRTFTAPGHGAYRIGIFDERRFNVRNAPYIGQDLDRNGNPKGDDGRFGVLWNEKTNDVWVDTDRDLSFADETALTDFIRRPRFGVLGKDDPATPVRESVGFAVQTDSKNKFVAINPGIYQHGTITMGAAVGNREPHGLLEGVAPGARMLLVNRGGSTYSMAESLIVAFRHPLVDLIDFNQSAPLVSLSYALSDGRHPLSILIQRLVVRYNKLMFVPGGNSPAFGFVGEDGAAPGAISVGGYQSAESYRINAGVVAEHYDNMHWGALSHGPTMAGALKPDLLAPSGQISTDPGYRPGGSLKGLFQLPPGYQIGSGTSTAAPTAAAAAALLVSAAKQSGIRYDAASLKAALVGSARYIPRLGAHEQGNGLIQVAGAIELLGELQQSKALSIVATAPVHNKLSPLFVTPNQGDGIYEREGWRVGERRERQISLTRTSGPFEPMTFTLRWQGNDGTFSSPASVSLPLNEPVDVPVSVSAQKEGAHTAILTLEHPAVPGPAHRILNSLIVPYQLTADNGYALRTEVTPPLPGDASIFVNVPVGASALTVSAASPDVRITLTAPDRGSRRLGCIPAERLAPTCTYGAPMAGVWEVNVRGALYAPFEFVPGAPSPLKSRPVAVTVSITHVEVKASPSAASNGTTHPVLLTLTNKLSKVRARAGTASLGSLLEERASIAQGEQRMYVIDVPKGTESLRASLGTSADSGADLDLYLLDCATAQGTGLLSSEGPDPSCTVREKVDDMDGNGEVEVATPRPGRWFAVVDAFSVPGGRVDYRYADALTHPKFGSLAVADTQEERATGDTWSVKGNVWIAERPAAPRKLIARIPVISDSVGQSARVPEHFAARPAGSSLVPIGAAEVLIE